MDQEQTPSLQNFLDIPTQEKEPLIHNLLYRRDLVGFGGRRRNGKTTLSLNISVSLAAGRNFLDYQIDKPRKVLALLLEDDTWEIQDKVKLVIGDQTDQENVFKNLFITTREYFAKRKILVSLQSKPFIRTVKDLCDTCQPDCIIIDNAAQLVQGDVNNAMKIHKLATLCFDLSQKYNCAIIVPAHPRKANENAPSLTTNPEGFFEEIMGSSHFVNSFGSLWGIQRNADDLTHFLGGSQRLTGFQNVLALRKRDDGWFEPVDDWDDAFDTACNTRKRQDAWKALPLKFAFSDGCRIVEAFIHSRHAFNDWIQHCLRAGILVKQSNGTYAKRTKEGMKKKPSQVDYIKEVKSKPAKK